MYVLHGHVEKGKFVSLGDLKSRKDPSVWQIPQVGVNEKNTKQNQNKIKKPNPKPLSCWWMENWGWGTEDSDAELT